MKRVSMALAALALGWLAGGAQAEAQYCRGNVDCGAGWVCNQGTCVQGAGVQVGVQAGPVGAQGSVTVTQPVPPPPPVQPAPAQYNQPQYNQPQYAPQYAPQPAPVRYEERAYGGVIGGGIGMLAGGYAANIIISAIGGAVISSVDTSLGEAIFYTSLVPVAGPWIQLGITEANGYSGWAPWLIIDGLLQAGGLTMIILGASLTRRVAVRAELDDGVELAISPTAGGANATLTW